MTPLCFISLSFWWEKDTCYYSIFFVFSSTNRRIFCGRFVLQVTFRGTHECSQKHRFSLSMLLYAHLRIAGRLIARGRTKPKRARALLLNQDRKIRGFRSHRTALQTRLFSLSLSLSSSPSLTRVSEEPINLDPVARIMCAATKALTHYLLSSPLRPSFHFLVARFSLSLSLYPSFLRYNSHRTSSCVPPGRNKTQI